MNLIDLIADGLIKEIKTNKENGCLFLEITIEGSLSDINRTTENLKIICKNKNMAVKIFAEIKDDLLL